MESSDIKGIRDIGLQAARLSWSSALVRKLGWFVYRPYILTLFRRIEELQREINLLKGLSPGSLANDYAGLVDDTRTSSTTSAYKFREQGARIEALSDIQGDFNGLLREYIHGHKAVLTDLHAVQNRLLDLEEIIEPVDLRHKRDEENENRLLQIENRIDQLAGSMNDMLERLSTGHSGGGSETSDTRFYLYEGPYGRFMLRRRDLISDAISRGEFWDPHLEPVIREVSGRGGIAIDAGAYFGFISVQLSKAFSRVISFEPQLEIFQNLNTNLMLNGCVNVTAYNKGLYSKPGFLSLANPNLQDIEIPQEDGLVNYGACLNAAAVAFEYTGQLQASEASSPTTVEATTIDSLGLDNVSFIKIDCQGADYHVLLGAVETIRRSRPVIVFESEHYLEQKRSISHQDYERLLSELGYTMKPISDKEHGKQVDFLAEPADWSMM